jgi:hypothetical protein
MTEEEDMLSRVEVLMKHRSLAENEMEKVSEINAALMGHQNVRQKIKYVDNIKRENMKLKKVGWNLMLVGGLFLIRCLFAGRCGAFGCESKTADSHPKTAAGSGRPQIHRRLSQIPQPVQSRPRRAFCQAGR